MRVLRTHFAQQQNPLSGISEADILSTQYRPRTWWAAATIAAITVVSAAQMVLESLFFDQPFGDGAWGILVAHAIGGLLCAVTATIVSAARGSARRQPFIPYGERFLIGVGLGIITSLTFASAYAGIGSDTVALAIQTSGFLMSLSLISLQMPVACVVGGLTWHLLSKARSGAAAPVRVRREIEDPE